jgi:PAS domain S-box-containing protein
MRDAIVTLDSDQRTLLFNRAAEQMFRCCADEARGQLFERFLSDRFRAIFASKLQFTDSRIPAFGSGPITGYGLRADGQEFPIEASISRVEVAGQKLYTIILRDVSEHKHAEETLKRSEERFRALTENAADMVAILTADAQVSFVSPSITRLLGYTATEWLGRNAFEFIHPDDAQAAALALQKGIQREDSGLPLECRVRHKNGSWRVLEATDTNLLDNDAVVGIVINARDVTERKRAEQELKQSEERYRDLVENAHDIIYAHDMAGNYISVNRAVEHITGYTREEALKMNLMDTVAPEYLEKTRQMIARKLAGEALTAYYLEIIAKDGRRVAVEVNTRLIFQDGVPISVQGIARDVTERKRAEELLREIDRRAVEEYERLLDRLASLALTFGTARDLLSIYRGLRDFSLALTPSFAIVLCLYDEAREVRQCVYIYGNGKEFDAPAVAPVPVRSGPASRAIQTRAVAVCNDYLKDLGERKPVPVGFDEETKIPLSALIAPMTIMGRVIGTIEVQSHELGAYTREHSTSLQMAANLAANAIENVRLLNLEREKEEQLRQSQKMEAIGRLAGGIAHDFNNLLTVITGYSDLAIRKLPAEDPLQRNIGEIKKAGDHAASLTRQLLAFSRKQILQAKVFDLNGVVSDMEKMLRRLIGEDIELRTLLNAELGNINADPGQIEQVIMNLAVNARDAMPQGGKLIIETENVCLDEEYAGQHMAVVPGAYVMLAVSDTGTGMDEETQARIFDPFFTTKELGRGTGLGLSTVYGIVKQSGGNVWVYSEVGRGTTFKVYFPRSDEHARESNRTVEPEDGLQGDEIILLTEDEANVRQLAREILRSYGYHVLEAANSSEALSICERNKAPIQLLITDVIMPGMSGRQLADYLTRLRPEMNVLFMSGYTDEAIIQHGVLESETCFLQKPFTSIALARKVREALDKR